MRLVKLITSKKINALAKSRLFLNFLFFVSFFTISVLKVAGQDNSPYSRYGLGDIVPNTNIVNRAMGGITAAYADPFTINFNNPASYSSFFTYLEDKTKKAASGRVLFDVGINFDNRTLSAGNPPEKFTVSNALFSYLQLGIPLKKNWGLNFGLRPVSRIGYNIVKRERLFNPLTNQSIDSAITEYKGDGGAFLATTGMGFAIKNFSIGVNFGYLFGRKQYATKRALINDSVEYNSSNYTTQSSFGGIYFNGGIQYKIKMGVRNSLKLGAFGNTKQDMNATQDVIRETFVRDATAGDLTLDSVSTQSGIKGTVTYPTTYGVGFIFEHQQTLKEGGFSLGVDYLQNKWSEYRYYGSKDVVQDNWEVRVGGEVRPAPSRNYWSNVAYRAGFSFGPDYINVDHKLSHFGISAGAGLPIQLTSRQISLVNVALEYNKRGNNANLLRENLFRVSIGLSFSDIWFLKPKYD